jgi:serine/threonine-protein kinase RsbW
MKKINYLAESKNIPVILAHTRNYLKKQNFKTDKLNKIELAIEELLVNIVKYAYPDKTGNIEITFFLKDSKILVLTIIDTGIAFNPLLKTDVDISSSLNERLAGGLGIFFVRNFADDIQYHRDNNKNILTLLFHKDK